MIDGECESKTEDDHAAAAAEGWAEIARRLARLTGALFVKVEADLKCVKIIINKRSFVYEKVRILCEKLKDGS